MKCFSNTHNRSCWIWRMRKQKQASGETVYLCWWLSFCRRGRRCTDSAGDAVWKLAKETPPFSSPREAPFQLGDRTRIVISMRTPHRLRVKYRRQQRYSHTYQYIYIYTDTHCWNSHYSPKCVGWGQWWSVFTRLLTRGARSPASPKPCTTAYSNITVPLI